MSKFTTTQDDIKKRFVFYNNQTFSIKELAHELYAVLNFPYNNNAATSAIMDDLENEFTLLEGVLTDEDEPDPIRPLCEYLFNSKDWAKWKGPNIKLNESTDLVFIANAVRTMKREFVSDDEKQQIAMNDLFKKWPIDRITIAHDEHMKIGIEKLYTLYQSKKDLETSFVPEPEKPVEKPVSPEEPTKPPPEPPVIARPVEVGSSDLNLKELESLGLVLRKIEPTVIPPPDTYVTRAQNVPNIKLADLTFKELQEYQELLSALPEAQSTWLASYDISQAGPSIPKTQPFRPIDGIDLDGHHERRDTNDDLEFQDMDNAYSLQKISDKNVFAKQEDEQKQVDATSLRIAGGALLESNPVGEKTDKEFARLSAYATNWFRENTDPDLANHQIYQDESLLDDWTSAFTSETKGDDWEIVQDPQQGIAHWELPVWKNPKITDAWEHEIFNPRDATLEELPPWHAIEQE